MVSEETMMFKIGADENKAESIIRQASMAMEEKGYNPVNQLVGYLLSGDPAYVTSYKEARSLIRKLERDIKPEIIKKQIMSGAFINSPLKKPGM